MPEANPPAPALGLEAQFRFAAMRADIRGERNPVMLRQKALQLIEHMETQQRVLCNLARSSALQARPKLPPAGEKAVPAFLEPREVFDLGIVGWAQRPGDPCPIVVYSWDALMLVLVESKQLSREEACLRIAEAESAWVGPGTPMVVNFADDTSIDQEISR